MKDLGTALALLLVPEGVLYALFPVGMKRMANQMLAVPPTALRTMGLLAAFLGVAAVWALRR